jgi:predicted O-linked N-acetylglucosamine transferase (SPINDLY family)
MSRAALEEISMLMERGRLDEARARALRLAQACPRDAVVQHAVSSIFAAMGQMPQAVYYAQRAVQLAPGDVSLVAHLARQHIISAEPEKALAAASTLASKNPTDPLLSATLAECLGILQRFSESERVVRRAAAAHPDDAGLAALLAGTLLNLGRIEEATPLLRQARARFPGDAGLASGLAHVLNYDPGATREEQLEAARAYARTIPHTLPPPLTSHANARDAERRLRIGVLSPDLRAHSVAFFIEPWMRHRDRGATELFAYHTNRLCDAVTTRLRGLCDHWRDMSMANDVGVAQTVANDTIDVLIELSGHTQGHSLAAMHLRPAPVLVTYCGYPNTTGLECVDARIVDSITDPPGAEAFVTERLLRLDPCFLCYCPPPGAPEVSTLPALANGHVTLGSFNSVPKLNRRTIALWSRVLARVPSARLVLKAQNMADAELREDLLVRFGREGVAREHVTLMLPPESTAAHLASYAAIDIGLEPTPYHGTTTTCEAMWMGVPVVTMAGDRHASRVGASLLTAVGLPELIAQDEDAYVERVATLASDVPTLATMRATLRGRVRDSVLCDQASFAKRFDEALRGLWRRYVSQSR